MCCCARAHDCTSVWLEKRLFLCICICVFCVCVLCVCSVCVCGVWCVCVFCVCSVCVCVCWLLFCGVGWWCGDVGVVCCAVACRVVCSVCGVCSVCVLCVVCLPRHETECRAAAVVLSLRAPRGLLTCVSAGCVCLYNDASLDGWTAPLQG